MCLITYGAQGILQNRLTNTVFHGYLLGSQIAFEIDDPKFHEICPDRRVLGQDKAPLANLGLCFRQSTRAGGGSAGPSGSPSRVRSRETPIAEELPTVGALSLQSYMNGLDHVKALVS